MYDKLMQRRKFLQAVFSIPVYFMFDKYSLANTQLIKKEANNDILLLKKIIKEENIQDIKKLFFSIQSEEVIGIKRWWSNIAEVTKYNDRVAAVMIDKKIQKDFENKKTKLSQGWLISETEIKLAMLVHIHL